VNYVLALFVDSPFRSIFPHSFRLKKKENIPSTLHKRVSGLNQNISVKENKIILNVSAILG